LAEVVDGQRLGFVITRKADVHEIATRSRKASGELPGDTKKYSVRSPASLMPVRNVEKAFGY